MRQAFSESAEEFTTGWAFATEGLKLLLTGEVRPPDVGTLTAETESDLEKFIRGAVCPDSPAGQEAPLPLALREIGDQLQSLLGLVALPDLDGVTGEIL